MHSGGHFVCIVLITSTFLLYMGIQVSPPLFPPPIHLPPTIRLYTLYNHIIHSLPPPFFSPYWHLNSYLQHSSIDAMHTPFALPSVGGWPSGSSFCGPDLLWKLSSSPHLTICSHVFVIA